MIIAILLLIAFILFISIYGILKLLYKLDIGGGFLGYVCRYFTHYEVISIHKKSNLFVENKCYQISYYLKRENGGIVVGDVKILEVEDIVK